MTYDHAIDLHYAFDSPTDPFGISESELRSLWVGEDDEVIERRLSWARSSEGAALLGRRVVLIPNTWMWPQ